MVTFLQEHTQGKPKQAFHHERLMLATQLHTVACHGISLSSLYCISWHKLDAE